VAQRNIDINNFANITVSTQSFHEINDRFDLLIVNVTAAVMTGLAKGFAERLATGGRLIVSGLLGRQAEEMVTTLAGYGITLQERFSEEKWQALLLTI
jgi:ribosomal protein L11 methyltransferase